MRTKAGGGKTAAARPDGSIARSGFRPFPGDARLAIPKPGKPARNGGSGVRVAAKVHRFAHACLIASGGA